MQKLVDHVSSLQHKPRIIVVGDLILDEYLWGKVSRISPEAPVQVVEQRSQSTSLGGAANVANNLVALECEVDLMGVTGDDENGRILVDLLSRTKIGCDGIIKVQNRPTTSKTRVIANSQQILRIDKETTAPVGPLEEEALIEIFRRRIDSADAVILSDYQKGVLTHQAAQAFIAIAAEKKKLVIADPKGKDLTKLRGVTILTPNLKELHEAAPLAKNEEEAVAHLFSTLEIKYLLVTKGERGMTLYSAGKNPRLDIPTTAREVFDVTGAGDTVISVLTMALSTGLDIAESCMLANRAAGIVVGKIGASTVTMEEIIGELKETRNKSAGKIVTANAAERLALFLKNHNKRIVFTNGCFDILHYGHIKYLQDARALGDVLFVGLNSDSSIRRLKGEKRPLIVEQERARVLSALDCIDYVVVFDEDTPLDLITLIKPHILVKGGDYTPDQVVGKEVVEANGGHVSIIPLVENLSTSSIVQRILEAYDRPQL